MQSKQDLEFMALVRTRALAGARAPDPADPRYEAHLGELDKRIARAEELGVKQEAETGTTRGWIRAERIARREVRNGHLVPIRQVAKELLIDSPELEEAFRLPHPTAPTSRYLFAAKAMGEQARLHEAVFIEAGQPEDFLKQLEDAAAVLENALSTRDTSRGNRSGATAALSKELKKGRGVVSLLDAMIRRRFKGDDEMLAAWRVAKRISPVARSKSDSSSSTPTPPALDNSSVTQEVVHQAA